MDPAGIFGNSVGMLAVPWLTARETSALIVAAVSLLFFRVFRERCLLVWGAGWVAYGAFLWMTGTGESHVALKTTTTAAFAQVGFVLAMGLFAAAAPISAHAKRALTVLVAVSWVRKIRMAVARPF